MRFCSLGSGSSGNATLVEARGGDASDRRRVLVDCGFSLRELEARAGARRAARRPTSTPCSSPTSTATTSAARSRCSAATACRCGSSRGHLARRSASRRRAGRLLNFARDGEAIADRRARAAALHRAARRAEPLQLVCSDGARRGWASLTDLGEPTDAPAAALQGCDALLLECNHDRDDARAASRYPASLKARIGGARGHLANDSRAALLAACRHAGLRHVVAAHLSQQNNEPALARCAAVAQRSAQIWCVADHCTWPTAATGCGWIDIASRAANEKAARRRLCARADRRADYFLTASAALAAASLAASTALPAASLAARCSGARQQPKRRHDGSRCSGGGRSGQSRRPKRRRPRRQRRPAAAGAAAGAAFFLLAASGQSNSGNQGGQQERLVHELVPRIE